jgi:hypothetical protein
VTCRHGSATTWDRYPAPKRATKSCKVFRPGLFRLQIADPLDKQPDWQAAVRELEDTIDDLMSAVVTLLKMVKAMPEGD